MTDSIDITATLAAINLHTQGERLQAQQDAAEWEREEGCAQATLEAWHWDAIEEAEAQEMHPWTGEEFHEMCMGLRPVPQGQPWVWDASGDTADEIRRFEDSQEK